jgi:hypothetical protein
MNETGKGLCFSCVVFGDYQKYIPFYIYSALKVYPDAYCKIFVDRVLDKPVADSLDLLSKNVINRFDIDYVFLKRMDMLDEINELKIMGGNKRIARWLIPQECFADFDYVFIGDIDFLILKESESLINFHLKRSEQYGLPFSNIIRPLKNSQIPRLSGLHFIKTEEYYNRLNKEIIRLNEKVNLLEFITSYPEFYKIDNNEKFLYVLLKNHFDFTDKLLIKDETQRPWHGIHLGAARGFRFSKLKFDTFIQIDNEEVKRQVVGFLKDKCFRSILVKVNEHSVWNTIRFLEIRPPTSLLMFHFIKFILKIYYTRLLIKIQKYFLP